MGTVVVSLDAELAWGFVDLAQLPFHRLLRAREMWGRLLDLFDTYDVPATWAVVGHLFLDDCDGSHGDHPAGPDWFHRDPGRPATGDDIWYAPSLVDRVIDADVAHELACHSFSHVDFRAASTTSKVARAELRHCTDLAAEWGHTLQSFVFPRNRIGHRDAIAEAGFASYRAPQPARWDSETPLEPVLRGLEAVPGGRTPPTVRPTVDEHGLVAIPASLFLFCFEGRARQAAEAVWTDPVVRMAQQGIDSVVGTDEVFHLWLHPNNLTGPADLARVERVLSYIDAIRGETALSVRTMASVAASTA